MYKVKRRLFFKNIAVVYKPVGHCVLLAQKYYKTLKKFFKSTVESIWVDDVKPGSLDKYDLIISIGGDGTLLRISWCLGDRPAFVLPVPCGRRTIFYEDLDKIPPEKIVKKLITGNFFVDKVEKINVTFSNKNYYALNEITILTNDFGRVLTTEVKILTPYNETSFYIEGDGIILSTSTGSSAHALSAGGSIIEPRIYGILVTPVNPVNLNIKPIFLHMFAKIFIKPHGYTKIYIDGINIDTLPPNTIIKVQQPNIYIRLIRVGIRRDMVKRVLESRITLFK